MAQGSRSIQRIIVFLDILGMRSHLFDTATEIAFIDNVRRIILASISRKTRYGRQRLPHVKTGAYTNLTFSGWPADEPACTITSMSDSIVVSLPLGTTLAVRNNSHVWSIYQCLDVVFWLQRALLQLGILTRGAITIGNLAHATNFVAGSGLVRAYELETQVAFYPRVVFDESIVNSLITGSAQLPIDADSGKLIRQRVGWLFKRDYDGLYFVDYLGTSLEAVENDWSVRLAQIQTFLEKERLALRDVRARQKLMWLEEYAQAASSLVNRDDFGSGSLEHSTYGALETLYPRKICSPE